MRWIILWCAAAPALGQLRVVVTGDSHALNYAPGRLQTALAERQITATVFTVAQGGNNAQRFLGIQDSPPGSGVYVDYMGEALALDPDVLIFKLGTNDAFRQISDPLFYVTYFVPCVESVVLRARWAVNSRGRRPLLFLVTPIPIIPNWPSSPPNSHIAADHLQALFAPLLRTAAVDAGLPLVDANLILPTIADWTDFYHTDGIHMYANNRAGYVWLAGEIADSIAVNLVQLDCLCLADTDCDGEVTAADALAYAAALGSASSRLDLTSDGNIDLADMAIAQQRIGAACSDP